MENSEILYMSNPLEAESIGSLIFKYFLPAIVSSLVSSIYNIVDQIFVGNKIGELGNAATNVTFPLVMIVTTLSMTIGAGNYSRVRAAFKKAVMIVSCVSVIAFICFQVFPMQVIRLKAVLYVCD